MIIRDAKAEDAPGIARAHHLTWASTYGNFVPKDKIEAMGSKDAIETRRKWIQEKEGPFLVAESNGEIIGFACGGPERLKSPTFESECYAIYLLQEHQQKGYGASLFKALCTKLRSEGFSTMLTWVLAENPANEFYRKMGGLKVSETSDRIGGVYLSHFSYGWLEIPSN